MNKDWKASSWIRRYPERTRHLHRGRWAEAKALLHLQQLGLRLLERNVRTPYGEIDLIMTEGNDTLVFVEVRFRARDDFGDGGESVDKRKQQKLINSAEHYLSGSARFDHYGCRFDVVSIGLDKQDRPRIDWIADAF